MFPTEPVPEQIGAYQVIKYVGRIGSADVYIAREEGPLGFSRTVTLKMVRIAIDDDARFAEDLAREASICARLNHPVVVRMFDFFEYDRRIVLVLEQVEGASLERLLAHLARRKQRLGDGAIFFLGSQLAAALAHAHASTDEDGNLSPVIHRDIKPENVLIGWDGQIRLAGFALGKILGRTPDSIAGTVKGTPGYMSPEQARGERATVRSDVYGLGVLLWSLLGGKEPPTDGARPSSLLELRPDLPKELASAVDAALEPSPDRRRITCAELAQWLAKLVRPDAGREELRQKVLWLRATRGPASKVDPSPLKQTQPRRRQALAAMRQTQRRMSSFPAPPSSRSRPAPSSRRALSELTQTMEMEVPTSVRHPAERGAAPSARAPASARPRTSDPPSLRIPPPPPLPADAPVSPRRSSGTPSQGPPSGSTRPPTVRTVTQAPPPRTAPPPPRMLVPTEDVLAVPASRPPADPWHDQGGAVQSPPSGAYGSGYPAAPEAGFEPATNIARLLQSHMERQGAPQPVFTLFNQLLIAGLTAALVVALGIIFLTRQDAPEPPVTAAAPPPPPPYTDKPAPSPPPVQPPQPAPPPTPPQATTVRSPVMPDPSDLSDQLGYLMVKGQTGADVYLNGMRKGPTNEPLLVPCGRFFMRIAPPSQGRYPVWLSKGETVFVACKSSTVLTVQTLLADQAGAMQHPRGMGL